MLTFVVQTWTKEASNTETDLNDYGRKNKKLQINFKDLKYTRKDSCT